MKQSFYSLCYKRRELIKGSRLFVVAIVLILGAFADDSFAFPVDESIRYATRRHLGTSREWQKILFYSPNFMGLRRGVVDSKEFYLSPKGSTNSASELEATIQALFEPLEHYKKQDQHPICRFPRRTKWLKEKIPALEKTLPQVNCQDFKDWLMDRSYDGVSVVFSSSYPNNPSSLFGHTFIRMHRSAKEINSKLLDDAINFSAFPDTDNPLTYSLKGVAGGFPGYFSFTPYYLKVQEYSNADSRDLWEYRLDFSASEIENLILQLWEFGPHKIDYYYFDENCSGIILQFLEAAKPSLNITSLQFWVIPSDTVKTIAKVPNLITDIEYRPSALTRFLQKYRDLGFEEQNLLEKLARDNEPEPAITAIQNLSEDRKPVFVDALLEYIDYFERLAGSNEAVTYSKLRKDLLSYRTKLPVTLTKKYSVPEDERPDIGHDSARVALEAGVIGKADRVQQLHWRPALHDKLSSDLGFAVGLGIDFFDLTLRHHEKKKTWSIKEFYPIRITSLPNLESVVKRPAWNFSFGTTSDDSCGYDGMDFMEDGSACKIQFIKGGAGLSVPLFARKLISYSMFSLVLGNNDHLKLGAFAAPTLETGFLISPVSRFKMHLSLQNQAIRGRKGAMQVDHTLSSQLALTLKKNHELRASGLAKKTKYREMLAGYYFYF